MKSRRITILLFTALTLWCVWGGRWNPFTYRTKKGIEKTNKDLKDISNALESHFVDVSCYPSTWEYLRSAERLVSRVRDYSDPEEWDYENIQDQ